MSTTNFVRVFVRVRLKKFYLAENGSVQFSVAQPEVVPQLSARREGLRRSPCLVTSPKSWSGRKGSVREERFRPGQDFKKSMMIDVHY